jgi:starch synthase (maltosyl-transferring)
MLPERRRVRIGNQTAVSASSLMQPFDYAVAQGFDAFEWFPDSTGSGAGWTIGDLSGETRTAVRNTAVGHDISLSVHGPWRLNPAAAEDRNLLLEHVEFARDIGASLFNVHLYTDQARASLVYGITVLMERLAQFEIKLAIENTPETGPDAFNELFAHLRDSGFTDGARVGMCLDLGHANLCQATRNDYLKFVDLLDARVPIVHLHLHENYGDQDSHLPLFTGPAGRDPSGIEGLIERLKRRRFSGCIIFEQWPDPPHLLDEARSRLLGMIGDGKGPPVARQVRQSRAHRRRKAPARQPEKMIIYNLFPLLAGVFSNWEGHLKRAAGMGCNWVFVNPIQRPGASGSLYSVADYFAFNPLLIDRTSGKSAREQVEAVVQAAKRMGLEMMIDLVINHCSVDSGLVREHPEWFVWDRRRRIAHPFCYENRKKVVWRDLARFDHRKTQDREGLFQFFSTVVRYLVELGFSGFRCDAAYQVPARLWKRLISETKKLAPGVRFFAETLGCRPAQTQTTARAGFDYIFNSSKWWDYRSPWLMEQYDLTREVAPSISFPESHDTRRLCEELGGNLEGLKQRYLFAALFASGVMVPMGFEFGFRTKPHVVRTRPEDWEETGVDLTSFISAVNGIKTRHPVFQEEAPTRVLGSANPNVLVMRKDSISTREQSLIILNKDIHRVEHFSAESLEELLETETPLVDVSPEHRMESISSPFSRDLRPGQGMVLVTAEREE